MKRHSTIAMLLIALLLSACSHDEKTETQKEPTVLSIYVYAPDRPMVTRADEGSVGASDAESIIGKLQIWVFNHTTGDLISYFEPASTTDLTPTTEGAAYHLRVSEAFEAAVTKPNVDVYVLANGTISNINGTSMLYETTPRANLDAAVMTGSVYGAGITTTVSADGLPMSGVLRNVSVSGTAPVYSLPTVKLMRTVSKVRFVFSAETGAQVKITGIELNGSMIPTEEYLFLGDDGKAWNVGNSYIEDKLAFLSAEVEMVTNDNPMDYIWRTGLGAQEYEDKIDKGLQKDENGKASLSQVGPFYLRESDKQLAGTISYQAEGGEKKSATFTMSQAGDFSRNHTWIVYAYYGGSKLEVSTVYVKDWDEGEPRSHTVYNW